MNLDFVERLGYYFFLLVGLIAIPYLTLGLVTSIVDIGPDKVFFISLFIGLVTANGIFSWLTIGTNIIRNSLISVLISTIGIIFFRLTINISLDNNFSIATIILVLITLTSWETIYLVLRKINSR